MKPVIKTAYRQTLLNQQTTKVLIYSELSDSKRQQTTTVDNKRLINGLLLTDDVSLRYKNKVKSWTKELKNEKHWPH